jgi:HD-GYP domain-containing protein (c-di-GMP phosphodiesterase class II)
MSDLSKICLYLQADFAGGGVEVEQRDEAVWVHRGTDHVAVARLEALTGPTAEGAALLQAMRRGDTMIVAVGNGRWDVLRKLIDQGVFDVHADPPDFFRLTTTVRNAFDLQGLRSRASRSAWQIKRSRYELRELIESNRVISSKRSVTELLDTILKKSREITRADAGTVYLVTARGEAQALRAMAFHNDSMSVEVQEFEIALSRESLAGRAAMDRAVINIQDVRNPPPESGYRHNISVDERTGYQTRSMIVAPMITQKDEVLGVLQLINCKRDPFAVLLGTEDFDKHVVPFDLRAEEMVRTLAAHAAVSLETARLYEDIQRAFEGFVEAAMEAIEQRDPTTSGHSRWVTRFTLRLAEVVAATVEGPYADVAFTDEEMRELRYAGLMHDFGKIGVPEEILTKEKKLPPGRLAEIAERFDSARLSHRVANLARLRELDRDGLASGELAAEANRALDAELATLERQWDLVVKANEPTVLVEDTFAEVRALADAFYVDSRGSARPLLRPEEIELLMIRRGSLSKQEFARIQDHARKTDEFLSKIPWGREFTSIPFIASSHHERIDGTGYPRQLAGENIPLKSRMMAVADIYDALTASDRPYKKAVPVDRALEIIKAEARSNHLDPELVRLFIEHRVYDRDSYSPDAEPARDRP